MMTATERVLEVMRVKNLNNVQFSQQTGIAPASLSHLTSGRSNPSLGMFEKILLAFPDIDPTWLTYGTGNMFRSETTPTPSSDGSTSVPPADGYAEFVFNNDVGDAGAGDDGRAMAQPSLFSEGRTVADASAAFPSTPTSPLFSSGTGRYAGGDFSRSAAGRSTSSMGRPGSSTSHPSTNSVPVGMSVRPQSNAPMGMPGRPQLTTDMLADVVRETIAQVQPPQRSQRKIIEVRIFFDDGTYESFGGPR
jgi:hypothetical protein